MRALDCECGQHLEAANDDELFDRAREHVDRDHPDMGLSDEQVRGIVERGAYDKFKGDGPGRTGKGPRVRPGSP